MEWNALYPADQAPDRQEMADYVATPLWDKLCTYIEERYGLRSFIEYSGCSMARGWNVKFRKSGWNLCTLYPDVGCFTCLVIASDKDLQELELLLPTWTDYVQNLFRSTRSAMGGRWLMVRVDSEAVFADLKELLRIRWNRT